MNSYFLDLNKLQGKRLAEGIIAKPVYYDEKVMIVLFEVNETVPRHRHQSFQFGVILGGRGRFRIGDEVKDVERGTFYYIPSNLEHELEVYDAPIYALDVFMPPRPDYEWLFER